MEFFDWTLLYFNILWLLHFTLSREQSGKPYITQIYIRSNYLDGKAYNKWGLFFEIVNRNFWEEVCFDHYQMVLPNKYLNVLSMLTKLNLLGNPPVGEDLSSILCSHGFTIHLWQLFSFMRKYFLVKFIFDACF